jgi:hypothetical protein
VLVRTGKNNIVGVRQPRLQPLLLFILGDKQMAKINKLVKVNDNISVNRYDNGWMVEINGRDKKDDWKSVKVMCASEDELFALIKEYNGMELE